MADWGITTVLCLSPTSTTRGVDNARRSACSPSHHIPTLTYFFPRTNAIYDLSSNKSRLKARNGMIWTRCLCRRRSRRSRRRKKTHMAHTDTAHIRIEPTSKDDEPSSLLLAIECFSTVYRVSLSVLRQLLPHLSTRPFSSHPRTRSILEKSMIAAQTTHPLESFNQCQNTSGYLPQLSWY